MFTILAKKKKIILVIILGLIAASLIFYTGIYFTKMNNPSYYKNKLTDFNWISLGGFGLIKEIKNPDIVIKSRTEKDKTITVKTSKYSRFNNVLGIDPKTGKRITKPINFEDLKPGDQVFYFATLNKEGVFYLSYINVKPEN